MTKGEPVVQRVMQRKKILPEATLCSHDAALTGNAVIIEPPDEED